MNSALHRTAVLDSGHVGDIRGALGTIARDDTAPRGTIPARLKTLLAIIGPGLIVMVGDNDAGAFATYGQAGQDYGTHLLWTLLLLIPVLYVNQEMVLRLAAGYLGLPKIPAVLLAAAVIVAAAFSGSFRRFERIAVTFCAGSLLLIPVYLMAHPAASQMARGLAVPSLPGGAGQLSTVMLLIIGIVGTTVAPWQLFFQQS